MGNEYSHTVEIFNDEFRFLKPSENCLDCYLPSTWNISFNDSAIMVEAQSDLSVYDPFGSTIIYKIEIMIKLYKEALDHNANNPIIENKIINTRLFVFKIYLNLTIRIC